MTIAERLISEIRFGNPVAIEAVTGILNSVNLVTIADDLVDPIISALKTSRERDRYGTPKAAADVGDMDGRDVPDEFETYPESLARKADDPSELDDGSDSYPESLASVELDERTRRDEKNGLYGGKEDPCN